MCYLLQKSSESLPPRYHNLHRIVSKCNSWMLGLVQIILRLFGKGHFVPRVFVHFTILFYHVSSCILLFLVAGCLETAGCQFCVRRIYSNLLISVPQKRNNNITWQERVNFRVQLDFVCFRLLPYFVAWRLDKRLHFNSTLHYLIN